MARRARRDVNLLRLAELLQAHITPALCQAAFGRVRRTERQRAWTLTTLVTVLGGGDPAGAAGVEPGLGGRARVERVLGEPRRLIAKIRRQTLSRTVT